MFLVVFKQFIYFDLVNELLVFLIYFDIILVFLLYSIFVNLGIVMLNGVFMFSVGGFVFGGGGVMLDGLFYGNVIIIYDVWDLQYWMLDGLIDFNYIFVFFIDVNQCVVYGKIDILLVVVRNIQFVKVSVQYGWFCCYF